MDRNTFVLLLSDYKGIVKMVTEYPYEEILFQVAELIGIPSQELETWPMGGYSKGRNSGAYRFVLQDVIKNIRHYDWVYQQLEDDISREVFLRLLQFRIFPSMTFIELAYDGKNHQYFDKSIVSCNEDEVFVDCGGFIGDTTEDYIVEFQKYKKIYVYEPEQENIEKCKKNLERYKNITIRHCGVGEINAKMSISDSGSSSSFLGTLQDGEGIEIVSLDEDIKEQVTFIKMDVEGFEIPAILGAKKHIYIDRPKLAICTYHIITDMWEIPKLIYSIRQDYKFYFRHYMKEQNLETVFYAIPKEEKKEESKNNKKKLVALVVEKPGWSNVDLIKDCGLIPYLFHKKYGFESIMVGKQSDEYTFLDTYVKGLKMDYLQIGNTEEHIKYIEKNAVDIDCLMLRGAYTENYQIATLYKKLNPMGKIYVGLDANSHWMDRIQWDEKGFIEFMDSCDVIATSCRAMQEHLNRKWPWKIEYITNGFFDYTKKASDSLWENKENIILTVGRIGTQQKAVHILLEAFAKINMQIPEWKLYLAGSIENNFMEYIDKYFREYSEYKKAKIFALTSCFEGGAPNVISEALNFGCVTAVTKFDAYEDTTDYGKCGIASEINNVSDFAEKLLFLCKNSKLQKMSEHAFIHGKKYFDMEKNVDMLYEMLYGGTAWET